MLDRDIVKKTDKIAKIAKMENPEQLMTRYIETLDNAIKILINHQEELINAREGWRSK